MAADLNQLVNDALAGIIQSGGSPLEEALYRRQAQSELESNFGKGLGISSVSRDALAKARVDAAMAAQQAQLSALGQAASVAQQELNRGQAGSQFNQQLGLQKQALNQQKQLANQNLIAQGTGLGVGALANVAGRSFGPEITQGLRRLAGLNPLGASGSTEQGGLPQQILSQPGTIDTSGGGAGTSAISDLTLGGGTGSGFSLPDLTSGGSFSGNLDLTQPTFDALFGGGTDWSLPDLSWLTDTNTTFTPMVM